MKSIWQKILSFIENKLYKKKYSVKKGSFYDYFFKLRLIQATANSGKIGWLGNSRIHEFESLVDAVPGNIDLGVSGSKIEDWLASGGDIVKALKSPFLVEDLGGNNFLTGQDLENVKTLKAQWLTTIKPFISKKILTLEITPLSESTSLKFPGANAKIIQFNAWLSTIPIIDVVKINDVLAPSGTLLPAYDSGDGIHYSAAAFPVILERITSAQK